VAGVSKLGRPPASDGAQTRTRILDAARSCFVERGYDQTTMRDIAHAADMTAGALYHHFTSKQDLFAAVFHRHQERAFDVLEKVVAKGGSFIERITLLLDAAAELHTIDRGLAGFTAVATIELQRHPELREVAGDDTRAVYRFFERMLAATPDKMSADDLEGLVNMFVAMFSGFSMFGGGPRGIAAQRAGIEAFKRALAGKLLV
jgi:AcrR family transcriptional regulator